MKKLQHVKMGLILGSYLFISGAKSVVIYRTIRAFIGDIDNKPQLNCVFQSDDAQNEFLSNPKVINSI